MATPKPLQIDLDRVTLAGMQFAARDPNPGAFVIKLFVLALLLGGLATAATAFAGWTAVPVSILLGALFAHQTELVHECIHGTATGRRRLDHRIGKVLSLITLSSYWYYFSSHLAHHRNNGTPEDRESFGYAYDAMLSQSRGRRVWGLLQHLSMAQHWISTLERIWKAFTGRLAHDLLEETPAMSERMARTIERDYRHVGFVLAFGIALATWSPVTMLFGWFLPLLFWGPFHALIELPEHFGCETDVTDVTRNTRSIQAGPFLTWFVNSNNTHVGHHLAMNCPFEYLSVVEAEVDAAVRFSYSERSYWGFYSEFFGGLFGDGFDDVGGQEEELHETREAHQ